MLGLFEGELGQVHLVAQPSLFPHRGHERLDVLGDRFLAGDELRTQAGGEIAFVLVQSLPVGTVPREVDVGRIPEFRVATGEQLERQAVPVEPASSQ